MLPSRAGWGDSARREAVPREPRAQDDSPGGLLWTVPERERQQGGRSPHQGEKHARGDTHDDRATAPEKGREQPDEHKLADPYAAGREQGQQAENVAQRERTDSGGEGEGDGGVGDEPSSEHPQRRSVRAPAEHGEDGPGKDGRGSERLQGGNGVHQATQPAGGWAPDGHEDGGDGREAGEGETQRRRAVRGHGRHHRRPAAG